MGTQHAGAWVLRVKTLADQLCPEPTRGPQLGDLDKEIHPDGKKEREARGEVINSKSAFGDAA